MTQLPNITWGLQITSPILQSSLMPVLFWSLPEVLLEGQVKKED